MDTTNILLEPTTAVGKTNTMLLYSLTAQEKKIYYDIYTKVKSLIRMSTVHVIATVSLYLPGEP